MIIRDVDLKSVCMVTRDYNNKIWLARVADLKAGRLEEPYYDDGEPRYFDNRDRLFYNDGPDDEGFIGIWHWTAIPNKNGMGSDYITTEFVPATVPVEIIEVSGATSINDVIEMAKSGISILNPVKQFLLCCSMAPRIYTGVLCDDGDFEKKDGKFTLKSSITSLNVYELSRQDTIRYEDRTLCSNINIGEAVGSALVKNPNEIIKDIILGRASWSAMKSRGMTKRQWVDFKSFISDLPELGFYQEIANALSCSQSDAIKHFSDFMNSRESILEVGDIDSESLETLILNSPTVWEQCSRPIAKEWEDRNAELIANANADLQSTTERRKQEQQRLDELRANLVKLSGDITSAQTKLDALNREIAEREETGIAIAAGVQEKIAAAKENIADFVSELMLLQGGTATTSTQTVEVVSQSAINERNAFRQGIAVPVDDLDENGYWSETLNTIELELIEAGVSDQYSHMVASLLYAAYVNAMPILLIGPCGNAIGDAFSAAIKGRLADVLDCSMELSEESLRLVNQTAIDDIIVLQNPIQCGKLETICSTLLSSNRFFIATYPYAEDLSIEPKGIFNYMFPVMTELFVDKLSTGQYIGGTCSAEYVQFTPKTKKPKAQYKELMHALRMSKLLSSRTTRLISDFHEISGEISADADFLLILFPYAYCTGNASVIADVLKKQTGLSKDEVALMLSYMGIEE